MPIVNNSNSSKYQQYIAKSQKYFNAEAFKAVLEGNLLPLAGLRLSDYKQTLKGGNAQQALKTIGETVKLINQRLEGADSEKQKALLGLRDKLVTEAVKIKEGYAAKVGKQGCIINWLTSGSARVYRINELLKQAIGYNTTDEGCRNTQEALDKQTTKFTKAFEELKSLKKGGEERYQLVKSVEHELGALKKLCNAFRKDSDFSAEGSLYRETFSKVLEAEKGILEYKLYSTNHNIAVRKRVGLEQKYLYGERNRFRDAIKRMDREILAAKPQLNSDELLGEAYASLKPTSQSSASSTLPTDKIQTPLEQMLTTKKKALQADIEASGGAVNKMKLAGTLEEFERASKELPRLVKEMKQHASAFDKLNFHSSSNNEEIKLVNECRRLSLMIKDVSVKATLESLASKKAELLQKKWMEAAPLEPTRVSEQPLATPTREEGEDWLSQIQRDHQQDLQDRQTYGKSFEGVRELRKIQREARAFEDYVAAKVAHLRA